MEEITQKINKLEAKTTRTPMEEAVLTKLKNDLANKNQTVSSGNTIHTTNQIENIPIESIKPNPFQPRKHFRESEIEDLANSIKSEGLISPIAVTKQNDSIILIAGQKRLLAYKILSQNDNSYLSIQSYIIPTQSQSQIAIMSIAENLARENPFVLDTANAIKNLFELLLQENPSLSQNQFSSHAKEFLGIKSKGTISKYLQIASLDDRVKEEIFKLNIDSFTQLYDIAKSGLTPQEQIDLLNQSANQTNEDTTPQHTEEEEGDNTPFGAEEDDEQNQTEEPETSKKQPKTKINISYLINKISDISTAPNTNKKELIEELIKYLNEFED